MVRRHGLGEKIVYFYVLDEKQRLVGVLPTRRLLTEPLDRRLADVMIRKVVVIPHTATVMEACEFFVMHKFFAFPVVDDEQRMLGVVDINLFTEEAFDLAEREQSDALFEALGFRVAQLRDASPVKSFRFRFPWLLTTIASGTICAMLGGAFEATLRQSLVLAFFLPLVLGLGESVSAQSMSVTIHSLRGARLSWKWFLVALLKELSLALMLGLACGLLVTAIAWMWRGDLMAASVIGLGILYSLIGACLFGLSVPALLHALHLDPKIASGPIALALADLFTLLCYFTLAAVVL
jgi:magnesium transporter